MNRCLNLKSLKILWIAVVVTAALTFIGDLCRGAGGVLTHEAEDPGLRIYLPVCEGCLDRAEGLGPTNISYPNRSMNVLAHPNFPRRIQEAKESSST